MLFRSADAEGRNRSEAEAVARDCGAALTVECDVADHGRVGEAMRTIVDTLGGARITALNPVVDESYPVASGFEGRVRIQVGVHGMSGSEALVFARSRHGTSDFDRAARQQQVIAAVRAQSDLQAIGRNIIGLATALKDSIKTDFPQADLPQLLDLLGRVHPSGVRSVVFSPPT